MSCCAIRVEWAAEIYCPQDRNQLSGVDYQNKRSEFSQSWAIHLVRGSTSWIMSEPELQIHMAHRQLCNKGVKTAPLNLCQLIRQVCSSRKHGHLLCESTAVMESVFFFLFLPPSIPSFLLSSSPPSFLSPSLPSFLN